MDMSDGGNCSGNCAWPTPPSPSRLRAFVPSSLAIAVASPLRRLGAPSLRRWLPALLLASLTTAAPAASPLAAYKHADTVMGTFAEVTAVAATRAQAKEAVAAAYARFDDVNRLMSDYDPNSEISRLSRLDAGESLILSPETFACLHRGRQIAERSGGAFDYTCRPLVQLWKQAGKAGAAPDAGRLAAVRKRVGWRHLTLDPNSRSATVGVDQLQIDLGGIAKGYALDLAAERMRAAGAVGGLVNVGGDVRAIGTRDNGRPWRIGIQHPFAQAYFGVLNLRDVAVATSGVQQRFVTIDGKRYSHIVDPRTGRPAEQAPSVTVIAPDGATADGWATAFSVLSIDEGLKIAEQLDGVEVLWLSGSAERLAARQTSGFKRYLAPADN